MVHSPFCSRAMGDAEALKAQANEAFKERHYARAVDYYTQALDVQPTAGEQRDNRRHWFLTAATVLFANRSAAHCALENYGSALADAENATSLDPLCARGGSLPWALLSRRRRPERFLPPRCCPLFLGQAHRRAARLQTGEALVCGRRGGPPAHGFCAPAF